MPITPTYPGIYIQEAPSSSHTIIASPTNIAVFIGYSHPLKTPAANFNQAIQIFGFMDYQRLFGGFVRSAAFANQAFNITDPDLNVADMAVAVNQFFLNGGTEAYIVALQLSAFSPPSNPAAPVAITVGGVSFIQKEITDEIFGMSVQVVPIASSAVADIIVTYGPVNSSTNTVNAGPGTQVEIFRQVSLNADDPNYIGASIASSQLVSLATPIALPGSFSAETKLFGIYLDEFSSFFNPDDFTTALAQDSSLDKVPVFNLMVLPGVTNSLVVSTAISFCERKMAFLIVDPLITDSADRAVLTFNNTAKTPMTLVQDTVGGAAQPRSKNAGLYFPYLQSTDPISGSATNIVTGQPYEIPPAATVAGIFAATDVARGVWKAPAGFQSTTNNTTGVVARGKMTDSRQGVLNPLSVNCLRDFPNVGTIVFGSRTLASTFDQQWTYVPVRRMALFLEQTFIANLKWVIFEPNAEPLWTAITMSLNAFMLGLFKQGAFQGNTPSNAFSVQCNSQTTTQANIDSGIVNIVVSFAPLKPAEFVVITIAQLAGQSQTS